MSIFVIRHAQLAGPEQLPGEIEADDVPVDGSERPLGTCLPEVELGDRLEVLDATASAILRANSGSTGGRSSSGVGTTAGGLRRATHSMHKMFPSSSLKPQASQKVLPQSLQQKLAATSG